MKRILFTIALAVLAAAFLNAQAPGARINVPFEFYVGETLQPAGEYVISVDQALRTLNLRPANSEKTLAAPLNWTPIFRRLSEYGEKSHVAFVNRGRTYTLESVWMNGMNGYELRTPKAGAELAKKTGGKPAAEPASMFGTEMTPRESRRPTAARTR
jgi:hypothetical protein